jgi:hypothetical protein
MCGVIRSLPLVPLETMREFRWYYTSNAFVRFLLLLARSKIGSRRLERVLWSREKLVPNVDPRGIKEMATSILENKITAVTEARDAFLKWTEGTQNPAIVATFMHLACAMNQARAKICQTMEHEGNDNPPRST